MKLKIDKFVITGILAVFVIFSVVGANNIDDQKLLEEAKRAAEAGRSAELEAKMAADAGRTFEPLPTRGPAGMPLDTEDYCPSTYSNITDDWITNVTFNTINNNSEQEGPDSYGDYTHISTMVDPGQVYTLYVSFYSEGLWIEHVRAWIDWNQDEIFAGDESYYLGSGVDATLSIDITIPFSAELGETRLRVIEQYNTDPGPDGACDPHSTSYGETEDYTVFVGEPLDLDAAPTAFLSPGNMGQVGDPIAPEVTFTNRGQLTITFDVRLIVELNDDELYNEISVISDLPSDSSEDIIFPNFTPEQEGIYVLTAISELAGDENPGNDTLEHEYQAFSQIIIYDFESSGVFEPSGCWEWGAPTSGPYEAHSGINLWATVLGGDYPNDSMSPLTTLPFGLSANAIMGFWHWYDTEARYDGCNVKISTDGGLTFELLHPDGGYDDEPRTANPLYPDSIFTGHDIGEMWQFETFDLSFYGGQSVIFRLDFGSDGSVMYPGWYVDDFTVMGSGGVEPGWISGTVTTQATSQPIDGAVVQSGTVSDTTGPDGVYVLELYPGIYSVTASAEYHNPLTVDDITVSEDDTTYQDFALTAPMLVMDDSPINVQMQHGEVDTVYRGMSNTGDGVLEFDISILYDNPLMNNRQPSFADEPVIGQPKVSDVEAKKAIPGDASAIARNSGSSGQPPVILDFGDEVTWFNLEGQCGDFQLLGAVFALDHFWVSGGNSGSDPNYLYEFDRNGNYLNAYSQGTSGWGWLDLTWDGQYIYGTDFNTDIISQFDPVTGEIVGTIPNPGPASGLGIAHDPATGHFWGVYWWGSNIVEFDRNGNIINSYSQSPFTAIFGLAWDDVSPEGPWLWVFAQDPESMPLTVAQFDPRNGYFTGEQFMVVNRSSDPSDPDIAGGLGFTQEWDPSLGLLLCLVQGTDDDWLGLYEVTPAFNWLQLSPSSGTIDPGESEDLEIIINLSEVEDTVEALHATINVSTNSPNSPTIDVNVDLMVGIEGEEGLLPSVFKLEQNYPNPFNARTKIVFALPKSVDVNLSVYNVLGRKVATLVSGKMDAGYHKVIWDSSHVASGVYYYRLNAGDYTEVHKMTLLK